METSNSNCVLFMDDILNKYELEYYDQNEQD
jgi:hypothetical protein